MCSMFPNVPDTTSPNQDNMPVAGPSSAVPTRPIPLKLKVQSASCHLGWCQLLWNFKYWTQVAMELVAFVIAFILPVVISSQNYAQLSGFNFTSFLLSRLFLHMDFLHRHPAKEDAYSAIVLCLLWCHIHICKGEFVFYYALLQFIFVLISYRISRQ